MTTLCQWRKVFFPFPFTCTLRNVVNCQDPRCWCEIFRIDCCCLPLTYFSAPNIDVPILSTRTIKILLTFVTVESRRRSKIHSFLIFLSIYSGWIGFYIFRKQIRSRWALRKSTKSKWVSFLYAKWNENEKPIECEWQRHILYATFSIRWVNVVSIAMSSIKCKTWTNLFGIRVQCTQYTRVSGSRCFVPWNPFAFECNHLQFIRDAYIN